MKKKFEENEKQKQTTEKKQGTRLKAGGIVIIFFLLMYVPSLFHWLFDNTIKTDIIQMGTLENSVNVNGVIIRNEELLAAPIDGTSIPQFEEGEKIPAHNTIATVVGESVEALAAELQKKDIKLIELQKGHEENVALFEADLTRLDDEIKGKLTEVITAGNSNSFVSIQKLKADINGLLGRKSEIVASTSAPESYVSGIEQEKESIQQMIDSNTREIKAEASGIVSYVVDGYEDVLKPDAIEQITPSFLDTIENADIPQSGFGIKAVEAEKPFARIIKDIDCYFVTALEPDKAEMFTVGDQIEVRINDIGITVGAQVVYKSGLQEGKYVVGVVSNKAISDTSMMRVVNIDLITKYYEGFKVPANSLMNLDKDAMTARILLVKSGSAASRKVKIVGMDKEYAVIGNIEGEENLVNLYDIYITRPVNIEEGQMITQ